MNNLTEKRFLDCVKNHKLTILKDEGVYRHIRMKDPKDYNQYYEIITYSGGLLYRGDMGDYVFERIEDMFNFFADGINDDGSIKINEGYWAEKCVAHGSGIEEFNYDLFQKAVKDRFEDYYENSEDDVDDIDEKQCVWEEIENQLFTEDNCGSETLCLNSVWNFDSDYNVERLFEDFFEHNLSEYTYHFQWCLYAIVYAIKEYRKEI